MIIEMVIALFLVENISGNNYKDYKNYRLYKVFPEEVSHVKFLRALEWIRDVEFWEAYVAVNRTQKVMVSPNYVQQFEAILLTNHVKYKLLFSDVQALINRQMARSRNQKFNWKAYMSLDEINAWLDDLLEVYSDVVSLVTIGKSNEDREIRGIIINYNKEQENGTQIGIIEGTIHAREWMSTAMVTWLIREFLTSKNHDIRRLAEDVEWHIFPVINPDGYLYSFQERRFWKKNRNQRYFQSCKEFGVDDDQSNGVDLNRNFDIAWLATDSASDNPCSNNFGGSEPFSEPETLFLSEYVAWKREHAMLLYYISFHAYSQSILIPYGHLLDGQYLKSPNYNEMYRSAKKGAERVKRKYGVEYKVGLAPQILYPTSSSSIDHMKFSTDVPRAYQIGMRDYEDHGYLTPPNQIIPTCRHVMELLVEMNRSGGGTKSVNEKSKFRNPKKALLVS